MFPALAVCLTYAHRLSPRHIGSGLFLRKQPSSGASEHTQHPCRGYVSPAKAKSRLQARLRGLYNRYFLYTVPLGGLTIAQLVVLALYCGSAVVADYVLQGAVAGNAIRSGRTACVNSAFMSSNTADFARAASHNYLSHSLSRQRIHHYPSCWAALTIKSTSYIASQVA